MIRVPSNRLYQKQNDRLVQPPHRKAIIANFYPGSNTADIYYVENPQTVIRNIPVSQSILLFSGSLLSGNSGLVGKRCVVDLLDETNPRDVVVSYIY